MKHKTTPEAYGLLMEGMKTLAAVEANGVRVDKGRLDVTIKQTEDKIADIERELKSDDVWRVWTNAYGHKAKLGSRPQLADVLFRRLGFKSVGSTAGGDREAADRAALDRVAVELPFAKNYQRMESLKKALSTYLKGIRREMVEKDGMHFVHPSFNLNTVVSFRSSANNPNWQNNPVRNPELADLIRPCYIPRPGRHFVEIDYGQAEVRVAACYTKDPVLIRDVSDPDADQHRDAAMVLFDLTKDQVEKKSSRDFAKNRFTFPEFYGSVYFQCAPHLWEGVLKSDKKVPGTNLTLREHLAKRGVTRLGACDPKTPPARGTFEYRVKMAEDDMWNVRYTRYTEWKREWYAAYLRDGGFSMLTGFAVNGILKRNDVLNYAIQCDAFQMLLWSLVRIVRWLKKYKMRTLPLGEIHDSWQADAHPRELADVLEYSEKVMTKDVRKAWPWVIVPLVVEHEVSPVGLSWHNKQVWGPNKETGKWGPK